MGVIGIVAMLVLPRLISGVQDYAWGKSKENSLSIISEATKEMKSNDVLAGYTSNIDFINVFSKYIHISKQCDSTNLSDCFASTFKTAEGEVITTSTLTAGTKLSSKNLSNGTIGLMLKNGTTMLFSLKDSTKAPAECARIEPYNNQAVTTSCMSFLYDINGNAGPNIIGKDIGSLSVDALGYSLKLSDGTKLGFAFIPTPLTQVQCEELGLSNCTDPDYWAGAVAACGGVDKLANEQQLVYLADKLYGRTDCTTSSRCEGTLNVALAASLGLVNSTFGDIRVWANYAGGYNGASYYYYESDGGNLSYDYENRRTATTNNAVCIVD